MAGQETFPFLPVAGQGREIRAGERVILTPSSSLLGPRLTPEHPQGGLRSSWDPAVPCCGQRKGVGDQRWRGATKWGELNEGGRGSERDRWRTRETEMKHGKREQRIRNREINGET